jgi:cholesterol transport system auxiliary component
MNREGQSVRAGFQQRPDRRRGGVRALALMFVALALAGCGGGAATMAIYDLTATATQAGTGRARAGVQILVPEPRALQALNTSSIAVKPSAQTISYYGQVQWADRLPRVLQTRIVQSFEDTGRVHAVGFPGEGLLISYQLPIEIRNFQLESGGAPNAVIEIAAKILDDRNGRVVASRVFRAEARASGDGVDSAVAAMDVALKQVLDELITWVVAEI